MRRVLFIAVVVAIALSAAPAWAHEQIDPSSFGTGKPTFLILSAANEKKVDLVKVVLTAPDGVPIGEATRQPAGWSVSKSDTAITWTGGAVKPEGFEQWGFETDGADQPGQFTYTVTLGFADGSSEPVKVPVTVVAAGATTPATAAPAAPTTVAVATTAATTASAEGPSAATDSKSDSGSGKATAALVLGAVAAALAVAALVLAVRRRPAGADAADKTADW